MARTVDPVAYAARQDVFVDAALRLIQAKGYEQLSVQDVIDEVGASKGAFFHYFESKAALLAAVVNRMVEVGIANVTPVAHDPSLSAVEKLEGIFDGIYQWKRAQPEFQPEAVAELVRTWYSAENSVVIERMRAATAARLTPVLVDILRQGMAEGTLSIASPEGTASVLTALVLGLQDAAVRLFVGRRDGSVSFERVRSTLAAYGDALERVLSLTHLELPVADEAGLRFWFGGPMSGIPEDSVLTENANTRTVET